MSGLLEHRNLKAHTVIKTPQCVCPPSARYTLNLRSHYATDLTAEELWLDSLLRKMKTVSASHASSNSRRKRVFIPEDKTAGA